MSNQHIENYLRYYVNPKTKPEHAVLITGEWGSGKTWFINKFVEQIITENESFKVFQVSLYGLNSLDDIASEYFRQAHPILSSRGMIVGRALGKAFAKGFLKLDLDGDQREDAQIKLGDLDGVVSKRDVNADKHLLVFDDVERCSIDIVELLGYINHFVEVQGYKAILLANEEKLEERWGESQNRTHGTFENIKEKLIGKTFCVSPDSTAAINAFVDEIAHKKAQSICKDAFKKVVRIYEEAGYLNLRSIKRALWNFEAVIRSLSDTALANDDFNSHFLLLYLIYSIELQNGLSVEHLDGSFLMECAFKGDTNEDSKADLLKKYQATIDATSPLLSLKVWENLIFSDIAVRLTRHCQQRITGIDL
ncbi:hypothetical protein DPQ33_07860 [Oceanidesulfovibrio indonesiensis]|uniref:KAP NTPase domain-containing protein n=1 Tax=Oceanidesulfovibrio indonesiensis TaxID=54767 RepID=A0A7M3MGL0_9BACT|nr:P-loop NTPase fold protein [Oceanidesulfovibrio indonesiensis]TVM18012.1 hypothetical protein DPQ33_07860 [Oceanidesulfovibrio indonesiensis]